MFLIDSERILNKSFNHYGGCKTCAHALCCKIFPATVESEDVPKIANLLNMNTTDLIDKYLLDVSIKHPSGLKEIRYMMNDIPCPFLDNDRCTVYSARPLSCRFFPFQPGFEAVVLEGICICPTATLIASEIMEFINESQKKMGLSKEEIERLKQEFEKNLSNIKMKKAVLDPIDKKYEEMGIEEIGTQGYIDTYSKEAFQRFLKDKKLL